MSGRLSCCRTLAAISIGLLALGVAAQVPTGIGLLKIDEYSQQSATAEQAGLSDLGIDVAFLAPPPASTTVRLQGPASSLTLQRQTDGSYQGEQQFATRAALDAAYPDGAYTVSVSDGTAFSASVFSVVFGAAIPPVLISNYDALQAWPSYYATILWQPIPGASMYDTVAIDISTPAGVDVAWNSETGNMGFFDMLPLEKQTPLIGDLTYTRTSNATANGGVTAILMGSGSDIEFGLEYIPVLPVFNAQPASGVYQLGATFTFSGYATSDLNNPATYQWFKNGVAIPGATASTYTITNARLSDAGAFTVAATNPAGTVVSNAGVVAISGTLSFSIYAGVPLIAGSNDGPAATATFSGPNGLAVDALGNVYVCDSSNYTIRKITPTGVVGTFAGQAGQRGGADGPGGSARFASPQAIAIDTAGNL